MRHTTFQGKQPEERGYLGVLSIDGRIIFVVVL
jgi:hypothetical protein